MGKEVSQIRINLPNHKKAGGVLMSCKNWDIVFFRGQPAVLFKTSKPPV